MLTRCLKRLACLVGRHQPLGLTSCFPYFERLEDDDGVPVVDIRLCARCGVVYWTPAMTLEWELSMVGAKH
jgi:hypothetical protein